LLMEDEEEEAIRKEWGGHDCEFGGNCSHHLQAQAHAHADALPRTTEESELLEKQEEEAHTKVSLRLKTDVMNKQAMLDRQTAKLVKELEDKTLHDANKNQERIEKHSHHLTSADVSELTSKIEVVEEWAEYPAEASAHP